MVEPILALLNAMNLSLLQLQADSLIRIDKSTVINIYLNNQNIIFHPSSATTELKTTAHRPTNMEANAPSAGPNRTPSSGNNSTITFGVPHKSTSRSRSTAQPRSWPLSTGMYLRLTEPDWWHAPPQYLDITPTLRLVSIGKTPMAFPSQEAHGLRKITVNKEQDHLHIHRHFDDMQFEAALAPSASDKRRTWKNNTWTLEYIRSGRPRVLQHTVPSVVVQYHKRCATALWHLTNRHPRRGDEGYLLVQK